MKDVNRAERQNRMKPCNDRENKENWLPMQDE